MNAYTGATYEMFNSSVPIGGRLDTDPAALAELTARVDSAEATRDEIAMADAIAKGDPIVRVDPAVAQRLRLGDRELRRRKRRR